MHQGLTLQQAVRACTQHQLRIAIRKVVRRSSGGHARRGLLPAPPPSPPAHGAQIRTCAGPRAACRHQIQRAENHRRRALVRASWGAWHLHLHDSYAQSAAADAMQWTRSRQQVRLHCGSAVHVCRWACAVARQTTMGGSNLRGHCWHWYLCCLGVCTHFCIHAVLHACGQKRGGGRTVRSETVRPGCWQDRACSLACTA